eukprot:gnl/MRDRNA2_/MRDRNA2_58375_c0_seq1.p1 gnl/MRDRNA2_/MRDRNA2_58375_c0~~gnl/MRDRNA2_/MRDRNA2_58375_c0_seq1.p1  ORF type:complete len:766 (-),score=167.20 gnl/MRDRNA2_/MRDRNA2_58375_c0_seq1:57-2354(-)
MVDQEQPDTATASYAEAIEVCQRERPDFWARLQAFEIKAVDEFFPPPRSEKPLPAEAMKSLFRRFKSMETGYLDVAGLEGLCKALAKQYSKGKEFKVDKKETLQAVRRLLDSDGDGMVSEKEFTARFNMFWQRRQDAGGLLALVEHVHRPSFPQAKSDPTSQEMSGTVARAQPASPNAANGTPNPNSSISRIRSPRSSSQNPDHEASDDTPHSPGPSGEPDFGTSESWQRARQVVRVGQFSRAFGASQRRPRAARGLKDSSGEAAVEDSVIPPSTGGTGDEDQIALVNEVEEERDMLRDRVAALEAQLAQAQVSQDESQRIMDNARFAPLEDAETDPNFIPGTATTDPLVLGASGEHATGEAANISVPASDSPLKEAPPVRRESILQEVKSLVNQIQEPLPEVSGHDVVDAEATSKFSVWSAKDLDPNSPLADALEPASSIENATQGSPLQDGPQPSPNGVIELGSPNRKLVQAAAHSPAPAHVRKAHLQQLDIDKDLKEVHQVTEELLDAPLLDVVHSRSSPSKIDFSHCKDLAEAVMEGVQVLQALRTCRICLEELREDEALRALPCSHYFHKSCIDRWLRINFGCPLCRNDMIRQGPPQAAELIEQEEGALESPDLPSPGKTLPDIPPDVPSMPVLDECWDVAYCDLLSIADGDKYSWIAQELRLAPLPKGVVAILRADNVIVGLPDRPELAEEVFSHFDESTMVLFLKVQTLPGGLLDINVSPRHPYQLPYERILSLERLVRNFKNVQWEPLIDSRGNLRV